MPQKRVLLFVVVVLLLFGVWYGLQIWLFPQKPQDATPPVPDAAMHAALGPWDMKQIRDLADKQRVEAAKPVDFGFWDLKRIRQWAIAKEPESKSARIALGSQDEKSPYHLYVLLDSHGAVVRQVILNKFKATNEETGKPMPDKLLELVPDKDPNAPAYNDALYHFVGEDVQDPKMKARPVGTLGEVNWEPSAPADREVSVEGRKGQRVEFKTEIDGVEITKVFTLFPKEYHVHLEVRLRNLTKEDRFFRYQLVGSRGVPIEGRWYTSTFRNALIGTVDSKGYVERDLQDLRQIGTWEGGRSVDIDPNSNGFIRYAGIADQYFASVIVVTKDNAKENFLIHARPTLERALVKGKVVTLSPPDASAPFGKVVIARTDTIQETFYFSNDLQHAEAEAAKEHPLALIVHTDPQFRPDTQGEPRSYISKIVVQDPASLHPVWEDDITVRVATAPIPLKSGETVVHQYMLYNGPVKPLLLSYVPTDMGVSDDLIERYDKLGLNTMTDSHSPGVMGTIASNIWWTWLVIHCTNVMHWVLHKIRWLIPSYGLAIICLTILVRGMMFPISRKGAMTSIRMQELAPELKKLQEKYKDDPQAKGMAQMELYRKHGVSPFGTCWFMFLQMPIFMGLYYALQESITFRLAPFQPLWFLNVPWIENLAAPDMLIEWGQSIPWLSSPDSYGGFLYLGPYLNVLPIIAVVLMIMQQKLITPPPTDEQQEMQQKMMKYMMVIFGLMFYKVASGLCLYFIASSLWGFAERKLLPRKKPTTLTPTDGGAAPATSTTLLSRVLGGATTDSNTTAVTATAPAKGKGRRRGKDRGAVPSEEPQGWWRRKLAGLSDWWAKVLHQARKKER